MPSVAWSALLTLCQRYWHVSLTDEHSGINLSASIASERGQRHEIILGTTTFLTLTLYNALGPNRPVIGTAGLSTELLMDTLVNSADNPPQRRGN